MSISTHALTEGDISCQILRCLCAISTHALTEGDCYQKLQHERHKNFNSRPHGGRHNFVVTEDGTCISTHALTEGDRAKDANVARGERNFNSRPHGGRPIDHGMDVTDLQISTHALTEGDAGH